MRSKEIKRLIAKAVKDNKPKAAKKTQIAQKTITTIQLSGITV